MDDPVASVFAFRPAYLGLQEALSIHGLWEQETNVVLVTPRAVRSGERSVMGNRVIVRRIKRRHFFGFDFLRLGSLTVPVSDVEKTLIDLAYFRQTPDQDALAELREKCDHRKVERYMSDFPVAVQRKVREVLSAGRLPRGV